MKPFWNGSENSVLVFNERGNFKKSAYCISSRYRNYGVSHSLEKITVPTKQGEDTYIPDEDEEYPEHIGEITAQHYDCWLNRRLRYWYLENIRRSAAFAPFVAFDSTDIPIITLDGTNSYKWEIVQTSLVRFIWEYPYLIYMMWYFKYKAKVDFECAFILAHIYGEYCGSGHSFIPYKNNLKNIYQTLFKLSERLKENTIDILAYKNLASVYTECPCLTKFDSVVKYIGYEKPFNPINNAAELRFYRGN